MINPDSDNGQQPVFENHDLSISSASIASDKNHMASFVSTEFELLQTTIASSSFPSTLTATIEPKISSILPSSQPPLSSSFSIPPPTTIVPPSLAETISTTATTTTTTTTAVATTTTLNYNGLNGTDPYAFTTEARYFSLPIVNQVSNKLT